ncbi:TPA: DNA-dependent ATPase protein rad54 [Trebouxia sp. C0006]
MSDAEGSCEFSGAPDSEGDGGTSAYADEDAGNSTAKQFTDEDVAAQQEERRAANIKALKENSLAIKRSSMLPALYNVSDDAVCLRKPFKSPHPTASGVSQALRKTVLSRRAVVPWGCKTPLAPPKPAVIELPQQIQEVIELPPGVEPLVLWEPPEGSAEEPILVDTMLTRWLRAHQREGVQFLFDCVTGLRSDIGQGAILADDMGLGKTLQSITLLWTLLNSGNELLGGKPVAKRVIICCPTSLVSNWDSEIQKWLKGRLQTLPLCESSREDVIDSINQFLSPRNFAKVLIVSYETFRLHTEKFKSETACDLLICDEAHRLKNDQTLTNKALGSLKCKRRILLSGTPVQNNLDEFYAMASFCNPKVFESPAHFRRYYDRPILAGQEPGASDKEVQLAHERQEEMNKHCNDFILRRTNDILSDHLPPKVIEVVCCKLTYLQRDLYNHFLKSKAARKLVSGQKSVGVLPAITNLKKLCNHPKLIYDALNHVNKDSGVAEGFEGCGQFFPPGLFDNGRVGRGGLAQGWELLSGKFALMARMLAVLRTETNDRIVIVSNYTQTLDLFSNLCRERQYPFVRLDGSTSINKRQKLVKNFNDPQQNQFVFLLSSKAGGCGLNLIGGNRLVLFDPDWNPATDKQAAARVWRDGQKKQVYVYRFITTGSIEEKVFQRQMSKEGLQAVVNGNDAAGGGWSSEMLRDLFTLREDIASDTYDSRCRSTEESIVDGDDEAGPLPPPEYKQQVGAPAEEDLSNWGHHPTVSTLPDDVMQKAAEDDVSFIFSCQIAGMKLETDNAPPVQRHSAPSAAIGNPEGPVQKLVTAALRQSAPAVKAPRFAAPRPSLPLSAKQQQKPTPKPSRHSAPGPGFVPFEDATDAPVSRTEVKSGNSKGLMRTSLPSMPRKPLACVSNKVLPKAKASDNSVHLSGSKRAVSGSTQADGDTLPIRKRKVEDGAAVRVTCARAVIDDDDDFR